MTERGYGVVTDSVSYKTNANKIFFDAFVSKTSFGREMYENYCHDNNLDPNGGFEDEFINDYENETYLWSGLEGIICDTINALEYDGETIFRYEDYAIYVAAYIPSGNESISKLPTQKNIREALSKYLSPILETPVKVEWVDIRLD